MDTATVIGIDLGGTKIAAGLVDPRGKVIEDQRYPTLSKEGRDAILQQIIDYAMDCRQRANQLGISPVAVGVATPGLVNYQSGTIRFATANLKGWTGTPIKQAVEEALQVPCFVENDANAAALAESEFGAGAGFSDVLSISVGTGIGGGVIVANKLVRGSVGAAGGFGHISVDAQGEQCYCGNRGCVEMHASAKAIAGRVLTIPGLSLLIRERLKKNNDANNGEDLSEVRETINLAVAGNQEAIQVLRSAGESLGAATASACNLLNPELVVVGGGIASAGDLFLEPMRRALKERTFPPVRESIQVRSAHFKNHAGMIGASLLAFKLWETEMASGGTLVG